MANDIEVELNDICPDLVRLAKQRDSCARLLEDLPQRFTPQDVGDQGPRQRAWELAGCLHMSQARWYEALQIFWSLYQHMIAAQQQGQRVHKGMPLVWMSDCFQNLGCPLHEKRYRMLTLCEDAIRGKGEIPAASTGA